MDIKDFYTAEDYEACVHALHYDCSLESSDDEPCDLKDLHDLAVPLFKRHPQLFVSERFYGFQKNPEEYKGFHVIEDLWLIATMTMGPNYWFDTTYKFSADWIESFVLTFNSPEERKNRLSLFDFGVTEEQDIQEVERLVQGIFARATWDIEADYTPVPAFIAIMLIDYFSDFLLSRSPLRFGLNRTFKQIRDDFTAICDYILSDPTIPQSILHKIATRCNPYLTIGLDSNPVLLEEDKIMFALRFGSQIPHEYSPLRNPIFRTWEE